MTILADVCNKDIITLTYQVIRLIIDLDRRV